MSEQSQNNGIKEAISGLKYNTEVLFTKYDLLEERIRILETQGCGLGERLDKKIDESKHDFQEEVKELKSKQNGVKEEQAEIKETLQEVVLKSQFRLSILIAIPTIFTVVGTVIWIYKMLFN